MANLFVIVQKRPKHYASSYYYSSSSPVIHNAQCWIQVGSLSDTSECCAIALFLYHSKDVEMSAGKKGLLLSHMTLNVTETSRITASSNHI